MTALSRPGGWREATTLQRVQLGLTRVGDAEVLAQELADLRAENATLQRDQTTAVDALVVLTQSVERLTQERDQLIGENALLLAGQKEPIIKTVTQA